MSKLIYDDIKTIIQDVISAQIPTDLIGGRVHSVDPLEIEIDRTGELYYGTLLIVPEYLTEHKIEVEFDGNFELPFVEHGNSGQGTFKGEITYKNALKVGDQVIMVKGLNGQKYFILDKVDPSQA